MPNPSPAARQIAANVWHRSDTIHLRRDETLFNAFAEVVDDLLKDHFDKCNKLVELRVENERRVRQRPIQPFKPQIC